MQRRAKIRKKYINFKLHDVFISVMILIIILVIFIVIKFNKLVTPKILEVASMKINSMTALIVHKSFESDVLNSKLLEDIIVVKYSKDEILGADFNMEKIYKLAKEVSANFNKNFNYAETGKLDKIGYYDSNQIEINEDGYILALPIGIASSNVFFSSLGPKIPVRIKFLGTVLTSVRSKVTDYGINNALIEVYLDIIVKREIITPVTFKVDEFTYSMPLSSKIIYGKVPEFYAGIMEKESANLNIPITN